jgi:hypothetical protein
MIWRCRHHGVGRGGATGGVQSVKNGRNRQSTGNTNWAESAENPAISHNSDKCSVRPTGFEPVTLGSEDRCAIQLRHGRVVPSPEHKVFSHGPQPSSGMESCDKSDRSRNLCNFVSVPLLKKMGRKTRKIWGLVRGISPVCCGPFRARPRGAT